MKNLELMMFKIFMSFMQNYLCGQPFLLLFFHALLLLFKLLRMEALFEKNNMLDPFGKLSLKFLFA